MNKLKGIIIDDEANGRNLLRRLIAEFCPDVEVIGEARNIDGGYDLIMLKKPDFVLLDIQMPGGNGFDLLKRFDKIDFEIIFVTSYNQYAIKAFKYSAIDYLLKPVEITEMVDAFERIRRKSLSIVPGKNDSIVFLLDNLSGIEALTNIALQKGDKVHYIRLSEISYMEAESNYTRIFTNDGHWFVHSKTLKYFEDLLSDNNSFFRIAKGFIVNIEQVRSYTKSEPFILTLQNGVELEMSRRKKGELLQRMSEKSC